MSSIHFIGIVMSCVGLGACVADESRLVGDDEAAAKGSESNAERSSLAHRDLLAKPPADPDLARRALDSLPVVRDKDGEVKAAAMPASKVGAPTTNLNPANRATYVIGGDDLVYYWYTELTLPSYMTDADGGTIRLILQHETDGWDQVRIIDEHIGTEYVDDSYGRRGRFPGRYGWTRQSGGGEWSWILGDATAHNLATPWDWAFITDYRWLQDNAVLPGDTIRIYTHPHVTARVVFLD